MVYTGPFDQAYFENGGPGYTGYENIPSQRWVDIADDIEAILGSVSGKDIIDVGCAYGDLAAELVSRGATVEAVDISSWAISKAQERHPTGPTFSEQDSRNLSFGNNTFHGVIALLAADCMPDLAAIDDLLDELKRIVKPAGAGYFTGSATSQWYITMTAEQWQNKLEVRFPTKTVVVDDVGHLPISADRRATVS